MKNGFAVVARRNGDLFLISFHENMELANTVMCRTIDADTLQIVSAQIQYAKNGNVQLWRSV